MVFFNQRQEISGRDSGQVRRGIAEIGGTFLFAAKGGLWRPINENNVLRACALLINYRYFLLTYIKLVTVFITFPSNERMLMKNR